MMAPSNLVSVWFALKSLAAEATPWTASLTYVPSNDQFPEVVCAENMRWFPRTEATVPIAHKPDF